jgi:RNA polymerase sigma factor (TIGR02999 family)
MEDSLKTDLSALIAGAREGNAEALGRLFELLYDDLRRVAHVRLRGGAPITMLDTTALVHESYGRFARLSRLDVTDRSHFMAYASRVMRSVIVDAARERAAARRGGDAVHVTFTTGLGAEQPGSEPDVVRVHEALEELAAIEARLAQVVEMRYFGGLEHAEIAEVLGVSTRTVERDWERARSFLYAALKSP